LLTIQPLSKHYTQTFQASPKGLLTPIKQHGGAVDKFVSEKLTAKKSNKYSMKDIFFEIFPQLDSSYRKIFSPLKKADSEVKRVNDTYKISHRKSYIDYDMPEYGIDSTGYGFGKIENDTYKISRHKTYIDYDMPG